MCPPWFCPQKDGSTSSICLHHAKIEFLGRFDIHWFMASMATGATGIFSYLIGRHLQFIFLDYLAVEFILLAFFIFILCFVFFLLRLLFFY
ncbi:hypothetical protein Noc_0543 [Nitrosococcus oceani ATCC 19707]|uniref:Uncharacterized protein n=2 Tax=Nitrosococcus oceani TaxID=1229 RepID=Q3JDN3_NITOC|nr:hypothetical protein Noc_0543 [Nitrosococcus oceani ATCC 19707]KFI20532.1 hypothetical protein IB75_02845 [Nitrosococcus oceani C-27]KFI23638.1 hypothetical protein HW44_02935 [Nitrosococcus oceani]